MVAPTRPACGDSLENALTTYTLDRAQLERALPHHLWLDAGLIIRHAGAAWAAQRARLLGRPLTDVFDLIQPQALNTLAAWQAHAPGPLLLRSKDPQGPSLHGHVEDSGEGGVLLVLAPLVPTERQAQIETMLELNDAGVAYFDADERLRHHNQMLNGLMSFLPGEALGLSLEQFEERLLKLLAPSETQRNPITELLVAESAGQDDATMVLRRERPFYALIEVSIRRSEDGGHVVFVRDTTRETETERMKSEFLSSAAHELRTPMASILGYTELLLHRPLPEDRRVEALTTVHRQSQLLMRIVNELLDLTRIEARQGRDMDRKPTPLSRLLEQIAQSQLEAGVSHPLSLPVECPDKLLLIDEIKAVQAVSEVLDNARLYSEPGQPVSLSIVAADEQWLTLEIRDRGMGMTPEEVSRVCERFWRADASRHEPGTGLGMSLVKEIIDLQGGWMEIDSEPGQGTRVRLSLPVVTVASIDGAPMDHNSTIATTKVPPLDAPHPR